MKIDSRIELNNGVEIPWLGLGVFKAESGDETRNAVRWALEAGYRHIDTAAIYGNETDVGTAIRESKVDREEIFITTKVWNEAQRTGKIVEAFDESRRKLGLDVIDLYLVHWPVPGKFLDTWKVLERLYAGGKVRAIGVSNFLVHHLKELEKVWEVVPAANQVEFHPFLLQKPLLDHDGRMKIRHEAWSPLTHGKYLDDPLLSRIAARHGKSTAQVLIRWDLKLGVVTIPKSVKESRIRENANVFDFELDAAEMTAISRLDRGERVGADPNDFSF